MNTNDIVSFIKTDRVCSQMFQGVFSCDTMPTKPRLFICNTDPSNLPGEHWIAIYVDANTHRGEYFDSFGRKPSANFANYMTKHCSSWSFNKKQLQSVISTFCGYYTCFFCMFRCRGFSLNNVVNRFTSDTALNDSIVHSFVCNSVY